MTKLKKITIFHFESDIDIGDYIIRAGNYGLVDKATILYKGNAFQFRNINNESSLVWGRLCKIRMVSKPKTGKRNSLRETPLEDDVIESCHFLYYKKNKTLLMEKMNDVSTNPHRLMNRLLLHIFEDLRTEGIGISAILRDDAWKQIIKNRGLITKIKVKTTQTTRNTMSSDLGTDLDFSVPFLKDEEYTRVDLIYKINIGGLKKTIIEKFKSLFRKRYYEDATFEIVGDRTPIKLSYYAMKSTVYVGIDENGDVVSSDMYEKLESIGTDE